MFWAGEASGPSCRTAFIVNSNTCGQKLALVVDKKCEDAFGLRSQNVENLSRRGVILVGFKYVDNVPLPRKWEKLVDYVSNSPRKIYSKGFANSKRLMALPGQVRPKAVENRRSLGL